MTHSSSWIPVASASIFSRTATGYGSQSFLGRPRNKKGNYLCTDSECLKETDFILWLALASAVVGEC